MPTSLIFRTGCATSRAPPRTSRSWRRSLRLPGIARRRFSHVDVLPPTAYLALSGGGDKGAFSAGFLNGWTKAGTRPQFKLVTGVSTGALIAPFAFLGPDYDKDLTARYTRVSEKDIAAKRFFYSVFLQDALADTTPLAELLKVHVDQQMLEAIAAEYAKGRLLLIGTTNLDAR